MNMFSYRDKFQNRSRGALPWLRSDIFKCNVHDQKNCAIQATLGFICKPLHKSMYMVLNVSPGFNSRSERCIYQASRPSQGAVNGGAVSK